MTSEIQLNKHAFQLTPSKSALLIEDIKRNMTPTRSISPFSSKNVPLPQAYINNKNLVFRPNPMKNKIGEQQIQIKRSFPVAPYEIKK